MTQPTIAIIGAGFSGTLLSLSLQTSAPAGTRIRLIEGTGRFATGPAYATANPNHLLNAPAGRMSAFADRPLDFLYWLRGQPASPLGGTVPTEASFVPRGLYGAYLQDLLQHGLKNRHACPLELIDDQVVGVDELHDRVTVRMASGAVATADLAVLAAGLPRSAAFHPDIAVLEAAGLWRRDPWASDVYAALDRSATVLLVGSGLTMVDAAISLLDAGHVGPIHAVSRHGLLPHRHAAQPLAPVALSSLPEGLMPLVRAIRHETAKTADWRAVIDALRPVVAELWSSLGEHEQRQFLRHLRAFWDVHRHRMAPQIADRIQAAQASNQLRLRAGQVVGMRVDGGLVSVQVRPRTGGEQEMLTVARVIDCTGNGCDIVRSATPLLRQLFRSGLGRPDRLRLGLDVTEEGALVSSAGIASDRVLAIGPLTRGSAWELTAVPELRRQCLDMARALGSRLAECELLVGDIAPWMLRFRKTAHRRVGASGVN